MITFKKCEFYAHPTADMEGDSSLGNRLFMIASTIGIAVKNGYDFGFPEWGNDRFFEHQLPRMIEQDYTHVDIPYGFHGFDIPDNSSIYGFLQSPKYFMHCIDTIRYYLTLMYQVDAIKDTILIHFRAYHESLLGTVFNELKAKYYLEALSCLPEKEIVVVTDNIERARKMLQLKCRYISNTAIQDFYLLQNADYIIGSNSSFSAMAAILSGCEAVFPLKWFVNGQSSDDIYLDTWHVI